MQRKRRLPVQQQVPLAAVALYRRCRELEAEGKGGPGCFNYWTDEYKQIRFELVYRLLGRRPWMFDVLTTDPEGERPEDYVGRDWEGAVALRRMLDAAIAS
jgi:hypothetical protein